MHDSIADINKDLDTERSKIDSMMGKQKEEKKKPRKQK